MVTQEEIEARRETIAASPDLTALVDHLAERALPVLARMPIVPQVKALLSRDGGVCPEDGAALSFDPWSPTEHRCPRCGRVVTGMRHDAHWARAQHLWIVERAAHLASLAAIRGDSGAAARANQLLDAYRELYFVLPNRDNVLGPSHLFFSTYLESIWILHYLAAAFILREIGALDPAVEDRVNAVAEEAATIIAEFNEGMSNRQTWNSAALTAIAAWFEDEELAVHAIEGRTGLLGHLADGFGGDGMWHEGENYHLFAMRGLLLGLHWARVAGAELLSETEVAAHLAQALMAPADTSLPDLTYPARKDSRYGVSLAEPASLECWEAGHAWLGDIARSDLPSWLRTLYQAPARPAPVYDAWLNDAGHPLPPLRSRSDLSWWSLWMMAPTLPDAETPWQGSSRFLEQQGLAVFRNGTAYDTLETGSSGSGHGHPDQLHLTAHVDGVHWLPDAGTGSYVARDLFWYRSPMAHNAPFLTGDHDEEPARALAFATGDQWAWCSAVAGHRRRALVVGPAWTLDVVRFDGEADADLSLPWHIAGDVTMQAEGVWEPTGHQTEFITDAATFVPASRDAWKLVAQKDGKTLHIWFAGTGDVIRATGPGLPGDERRPFFIRASHGNHAVMATVLDPSGSVAGVEVTDRGIRILSANSEELVDVTDLSATITGTRGRTELRGAFPPQLPTASFLVDAPPKTLGAAVAVDACPALDGSLSGFRKAEPLVLDSEEQYFRSEEAYRGADQFRARAYVNWDDDVLYLAVEVVKDDLVIRPDDATPLALDNEPDDINADGVQVYIADDTDSVLGWLLQPSTTSALRARAVTAAAVAHPPRGAWARTNNGYRITALLPCPGLGQRRHRERIGFDLIVNEMRSGRVRRAGQLVWSGGPGWVYLRGDRHPRSSFGELELLE